MKVEEIIDVLKTLGLGEYEAKAYYTLVLLGPSRAGELSKQSLVPQSKIYETLEGLIDKQLVEVLEGRPRDYKAVPPEVALRNLVTEREKNLQNLQSRLKDVSNYLKPEKPDEISGGIWTIKGRKFIEFFNRASDMIGKSRKYVYGVTRDFSRSARLSEVVAEAIKRGVKVRVLGMTGVNETNYFKAKWFIDRGIELRTFETKVHPRIVLVDGREVLLRLDHQPDRKDDFRFSSIWSQDPSLVRVFDVYTKNLWESAKPIDLSDVSKRFSEL